MALSPHLRERLLRQLDALNDERAYQVLDYLEFMTSKYGTREPVSTANIFTRFTEGVEDTLRAGKVSATAISETMGLLNKAAGVLSGVAAAGKSVASDIVTGVSSAATPARPTTTEPPTQASPPVDPNAPRTTGS
jgi:hypothetical protein